MYVSIGPRPDHRVKDSVKRGAKIFQDATDCVKTNFCALAGTDGYWIFSEKALNMIPYDFCNVYITDIPIF